MIIPPKQRFAENKDDYTKLHDLTASSFFMRACDAAMMQYIQQNRVTNDAQVALAGYHRITGAQEFLRVLLTLTESQTLPNPPDFNLNYKV